MEFIDERGYLDQVLKILNSGIESEDRTGTGTISLFGVQNRYSLRDDTLPVFTTKRIFLRGVAEELLWFISGSTDAKKLSEKNIHIWDDNSSREFLDKHGFHNRREGDLGPVYGFQWRHFGAKYVDADTDYTGQGTDQLAEVIRLIREEPNSRRICLTAWNPSDLPLMALPPCHAFIQFYVRNGELHSQLYQRSGDIGLGVPFNVTSYALLTHMIAHITNLKAGEFVHNIGDAHIYLNHVDALKKQLEREPNPFPKVRFNGDLKEIDDFTYESIVVEGYKPHAKLDMKMAV